MPVFIVDELKRQNRCLSEMNIVPLALRTTNDESEIELTLQCTFKRSVK